MPLSDLACRKAKPGPRRRKISDMGGLQLWIYPNGAKYWRLAYRFRGKQKTLAIGVYPRVSLIEARAEREKAKVQLRNGIDPMHEKILAKAERDMPGDSFEAVAKDYIDKLRREGRAKITVEKVEWVLGLAYPVLGPMAVRAIRPIDVLSVLRKIEGRGRYETARRLRSTIGAVCRYAVATARAESDPTVALKGAIATPKTKSRAAITDSKTFGALLRAVDAFSGQASTKAGLQLMALLFPRPGELRGAKWSEFDFEKAIWVIPAERMKMRRPHRIPLAPQALTILRDLQKITGVSEFVLHSAWTVKQPLSENTLNLALRRIGYSKDEMTSHGFRATAATLLNECGLWNADAIERQLAHVEGNDVRRAYTRGEYWEERVKMMHWWADHLDNLKKVGAVIEMDRASPTQLSRTA
jgi:integrase